MIYELHFIPVALKEWKKLGSTIQAQFNSFSENLHFETGADLPQ